MCSPAAGRAFTSASTSSGSKGSRMLGLAGHAARGPAGAPLRPRRHVPQQVSCTAARRAACGVRATTSPWESARTERDAAAAPHARCKCSGVDDRATRPAAAAAAAGLPPNDQHAPPAPATSVTSTPPSHHTNTINQSSPNFPAKTNNHRSF